MIDEDDNRFPRAAVLRKVLAFTFHLWGRAPRLASACAAAMLLATLTEVFVPLYAGHMIDAVGGGDAAAAWRAFATIAALGGAMVGLRHLGWWAITPLTLNMMRDVTQEAFARVQRLSTDWHANAFSGSTVRRITRGMWALDTLNDVLLLSLLPSLTVLVPLTVLETLIGIALALAIAFARGSLTDRAVMIACTVGMSISILVYIIVFQYGLAYKLGLFPVQGWDGPRYAVLPILIGLAVSIAPTLRLFRSFVLDEVGQDYVRTARAKGLSERRVMWVHVLRNAAIPILTYVMSNLPALLIGAFLLERFFGIPGIGREVILAVERSDFPVIKAITVYVAAATMVFNLLTDLLYQAVDPRVKLS